MQVRALVMGMPTMVGVAHPEASMDDVEAVFAYLRHVDSVFSTYKPDSEIERINRGELQEEQYSDEMRMILGLCKQTTQETAGFFDIHRDDRLDPSGIVKGYAIYMAAEILRHQGFKDIYVDIGGDIEVRGKTEEGGKWRVGIRSPFDQKEIVKIVHLSDRGIATSGTYLRGEHIYDPVGGGPATEMASLTVIGPNVYEADRFATAAFAMGEQGIRFIQCLPGFEAYMIMHNQRALYTPGFEKYTVE